ALTSAGHDFLDEEAPSNEAALESAFPTERAESLKRFRKDYPNPSRAVAKINFHLGSFWTGTKWHTLVEHGCCVRRNCIPTPRTPRRRNCAWRWRLRP